MRVKLQSLATVVCLAGILAGAACKMWAPEYWFDWYPVILVVFWVMEMIFSFVLERYATDDGTPNNSFMRVLMIAKTTKMLVTVILIGLYLGINKDHQVEFSITAVVFYLLNLAVETYAITKKK